MSGHSQSEAIAEMSKWKKISLYFALPAVAAISVINVGMHMSHSGHGDHAPNPDEAPSYMRIRTKPFPWDCPDCGLFEGPCHKKCQEAKAAGI